MARLAGLGLLGLLSACVAVDRACLGLRSIAGGIHNRRQVSGIQPFFLPDGRLGLTANGGLRVEERARGDLVELLPVFAEVDDPWVSSDGRTLYLASGRDQVTAGQGHNDHVFQLYRIDLETAAWTQVTTSRRAETLPRLRADEGELVFTRRAEYAGWSLRDPWGPASLFSARVDGSGERRLTGPLFHPVLGLCCLADGSVLLAGRPAPEAPPVLYRLAPGASEPEEILAGAAHPCPLPGTDEVLVARTGTDGRPGLARIDGSGRVLFERRFVAGIGPLRGLAVSRDGDRIAFSDFDPDAGSFGEYRLFELAGESAEPRVVLRLPYRPTVRYKPLDVVKPPSWWWGAGGSPGSR